MSEPTSATDGSPCLCEGWSGDHHCRNHLCHHYCCHNHHYCRNHHCHIIAVTIIAIIIVVMIIAIIIATIVFDIIALIIIITILIIRILRWRAHLNWRERTSTASSGSRCVFPSTSPCSNKVGGGGCFSFIHCTDVYH